LRGEVNIGGAGAGTVKGATVQGASVTVVGVESNPEPLVLAIPLARLSPRFGHQIDGIIGADFIKQYAVEVDYQAKVLRFHDKSKYAYSGPGEILPLTFINGGYPIINAEVVASGRQPVKARFVLDFGSGGSLALHTPFVEEQKLPTQTQKTIKVIGVGGAAGKVTGRSGRISELRIGKVSIDSPLTLFSEDRGGAFANTEIQGNIGQMILAKFKAILDYSRERIILEPNSTLKDPIAPFSNGLKIVAEGTDYRTFRIDEFLDDSPAAESGLQAEDIITSVDGKTASELTLTTINELLEKPTTHKLLVKRGSQEVQINLTPRKLI